MAINKRLLVKPPSAGGITPSEHFGVVLYEGDSSTSHSINGGKFGAGAYFGGDSVVDTGLSTTNFVSDLNDRTVDFSFSCWAQIHSYPQGDNTIFYIGNYNVYSPNYAAIILDFRSASKKIRFTHQTQYIESTSTFNAPMTTWVHIAAVRDNSVLKLYINGSLEANITLTADTQVSSSTTLDIGGFQFGAGTIYGDFIGKIDQVRIFTKALSSSEVSTLYAETADTVTSLDPLSEDTTDTLQVLGDSSCIAAYQFENNEDDLSGNYNGTGVKVQYAAGRYGQAARFGNSSYVDLGTITRTSSMTISAWVKTTGNNLPVVFLDNGVVFRLNINSSGYAEAGNLSGTSATSTTTVNNGSWNHLVAVYNDSGFRRIYVNSSLEDSETYATATRTYKDGIAIDNNNPASSQIDIDQVRIFNKALSAAEVTTLYNENSLVASYRFEGNANDDTRNYDGTASNVSYEYGLGFTPDFVWIKNRDTSNTHLIYDSTRGAGKFISSATTNAEAGDAGDLLGSFDTGGFSVNTTLSGGTNPSSNANGEDFVAWCLKANGGTTSSNTDGSITSTVQANTDAGFSIVKWTGTQTNGSIGHGLTAAPEMLIVKDTTNTYNWYVFIKPSGATNNIRIEGLNTTAAGTVQNSQFTTTSSLIENLTIYASLNTTGATMLAYAFHSVEGFSKIGSYTGNGTTTGPMVETGFEPAFIIIKDADGADNWAMVDNKRATTNPRQTWLRANLSDAEFSNTVDSINFYSNGFQVAGGTSVSNFLNESGNTFIYMAFAADPDTEAPTVAKSFSTVTYTGTGATNSIDGLGFEPSLTWIKGRTNTASHQIFDTIRGATKGLNSDANIAEFTNTSMLTSFDSDGFTLGGQSSVNGSGVNYVAWAWKADDNEPTINTEGSIDSIVSANANAGFSIVKYEGTGSNTTIGHSLSAAPEMMIIKNLDQTDNWVVYHSAVGTGQFLSLNSTDAASGSGDIFGTPNDTGVAPTSTVFTVGSNHKSGANGENYIAYCFHSVAGYSKIGSYTGTSSSGNSVNVGFAPDWVLIKGASSGSAWILHDTVRSDGTAHLRPNTSGAEDTGSNEQINFTSTGFSIRNSGATQINTSGDTYIYMAFKIN